MSKMSNNWEKDQLNNIDIELNHTNYELEVMKKHHKTLKENARCILNLLHEIWTRDDMGLSVDLEKERLLKHYAKEIEEYLRADETN